MLDNHKVVRAQIEAFSIDLNNDGIECFNGTYAVNINAKNCIHIKFSNVEVRKFTAFIKLILDEGFHPGGTVMVFGAKMQINCKLTLDNILEELQILLNVLDRASDYNRNLFNDAD